MVALTVVGAVTVSSLAGDAEEMVILSGLGLVGGVLPLYISCLRDGGIR